MDNMKGFGMMIHALKENPKTIVFTEGTDERILEAASRLLAGNFLTPILVGNKEAVLEASEKYGYNIRGGEIRVREGVGVDALQDEPLGVVGTPDQIGVVDMAFAVVAAVADHRSAKIKGVCCCQENGFCYRFHDVILVSLSFMPFCRSRAFSLPCLTAVFVGGQPFRLTEALGKVAGG